MDNWVIMVRPRGWIKHAKYSLFKENGSAERFFLPRAEHDTLERNFGAGVNER